MTASEAYHEDTVQCVPCSVHSVQCIRGISLFMLEENHVYIGGCSVNKRIR